MSGSGAAETAVWTGAGRTPRRRPSGRGGHSLAEVLVATLLLILLLGAAWRVLTLHRRAASAVVGRAERLETARTVTWVLGRELRRSGPDGRAPVAGDSMALRAFRGSGVVCERADSVVGVLRVGSRAPDPEKDSARVLSADGGWSVHDLVAVVGGNGCLADEGVAEAWTLRPEPVGPVLVRYFERGSYHVGAGALRYRRGRSGRQPLTAAVLGAGSGLEGEEERVRALLRWDGTDPDSAEVITLRARLEGRPGGADTAAAAEG